MSEPLVTRSTDVCGGMPCLRGTRVFASQIQDLMQAGRSCDYVREHYGLHDWSDEDLHIVATYPKEPAGINIDGFPNAISFWVDTIEFSTSFTYEQIPALIRGIQQARGLIEAWVFECEQWEASQTDE
jgi:hypothetical protein